MDLKKIQSEGQLYQRLKLLGQGAFGKAYLVKQKKTDQLYVIKQMSISQMSLSEQQQTLKQAKIIQFLDHPNIVKFKQVYLTTSKKLNIVMEYADGGDISRKIIQMKKSGKFFDQSIILDWFTQICLAMKHVHDRKIIHRDIKGQNIFITKNNLVKLGDFGIARILNKTLDKARTVVGTPYYLSPEIIQNKPYSFKSDIWSMGVLLYQLCALSPPFTANSLQFLALKIVKGSFNPIQGNYSKQLKSLISQILVVDQNKRPTVAQILKRPFIVSRIKNFLTQTQNVIQFSHTVIHNFKFGAKPAQNIKPEQQKERVRIQSQRLKLKQQQKNIQKMRQQKRIAEERRLTEERRVQQQKRKLQQKKENERRLLEEKKIAFQRKLMQEKRDQQEKKILEQRQRKQQQQKKKKFLEFARQQYLRNQQLKKNVQMKVNLQMNPPSIPFNYQQPVTRIDPQQKQAQKLKKQKQQQKKYLQFAREQYYKNQQIRKNAQNKANSSQYETNESQDYKEYNKVPLQKQKQQKKVNKSQIKYQKPIKNFHYQKRSQPIIGQQDLINAFVNPNFQKKQQQNKNNQLLSSQQKYNSNNIPTPQKIVEVPQKKINYQRPNSVQPKQEPKQQKSDLKKKIEQGRLKMKLDRQKFQQNGQEKQVDIKVGKWQDRKKQKYQQPKENIVIQKIPKIEQVADIKTIHANKWNKKQKALLVQSPPPIVKIHDEQIKQLQKQNKLLEQLINQNEAEQQQNKQFLNVINQLRKIVDDELIEKIESIPEIKVKIDLQSQIKDDEVQPEKAVEFVQKPNFQDQNVNLEYFSDYSKLQSLRITLQDVFGTENFIKAYRIIEKEFDNFGMGEIDIDKLQGMVNFIPQEKFKQYITLLMTLIVMQNKVNQGY